MASVLSWLRSAGRPWLGSWTLGRAREDLAVEKIRARLAGIGGKVWFLPYADSITGEDVMIRAHIEKISGYSGHMDSDGLLNFVSDMHNSLKKVYVVMGEPKSSMFLVQKIRDNLAIEAYAPERGQSVVLDF